MKYLQMDVYVKYIPGQERQGAVDLNGKEIFSCTLPGYLFDWDMAEEERLEYTSNRFAERLAEVLK